MSDYNKEVVPGAHAPVLSTALLARIHQLNRDYVELMLAERSLSPYAVPVETLPAKMLDALGSLSMEAHAALAGCPFALYSFGFDDQRFWSAALGESGSRGSSGSCEESVSARYGTPSVAPMRAGFGEVALFTAWHVAASRGIAARFLFGMPEEIAARLGRAPLWRLRRIAIDYPGLLTPRWPSNPAFWPDLVRFAAAGDSSRLETARLLGSQLIAAELDSDQPRRPRSRLSIRCNSE